MDPEVSVSKWYCRCGKTKYSEERPKEEDELYTRGSLRYFEDVINIEAEMKGIHTHIYYLVPAPSGTEQVALREAESERDHDNS